MHRLWCFMNKELKEWCDDLIRENSTIREWEMYQKGIKENEDLSNAWKEKLETENAFLKKAIQKIESLPIYDFERQTDYFGEVKAICKFVKNKLELRNQ